MKKAKSKKKPVSKRTPYSKASDNEKVKRNWNKAKGLYNRSEYSVAVLRCGTCVELVVNFAIRQELVVGRDLPLPFVDKLLKNANGLRNKYHNIYLPIMAEWQEYDDLKKLWKDHIDKINQERNAVAHSGEFRSKSVAEKVLAHTYDALQQIMDIYEHNTVIRPFEA